MTKSLGSTLQKKGRTLFDSLTEYYLHGYVTEQKQSIWDWLFSGKCPISIEVYNLDGELIGYVGDDELWYDDSILIERNGDEKRIYTTADNPVSLRVIGTDDGTMCFTVEDYTDGEASGRVNYYDIPLEEGKQFSLALQDGGLSGTDSIEFREEEGELVQADEYIPATMNARVQINATSNDTDAGVIIGEGYYVRGDAVTLQTLPSDGYVFMGWYADEKLLSASNIYEFTARENMTLTAQFIQFTPSFENYLVNISDKYQDVYDIVVEQENDDFVIHVTYLDNAIAADNNLTVLLVQYDEHGKMSRCETLMGEEVDDGVNFSGTIVAQDSKLFILDKDFIPVIEAYLSE